MARFNLERSRKLLQQFNFHDLFIEELGWEQPARSRPDTITCDGLSFTRRQIAQLSGVVVFELTAEDGHIPEAKARAAVQRQITEQYYENLLIFVDDRRTQSVWYWVKRDGSKRYPRSHHYVKGQTGDLFLGKISAVFVDMSELDEEGHIPVVEVANRMKAALDIERVTKKFFDQFQLAHANFLGYIGGIDDERERRWYTSVILNRVMFIWFLQRKGFVNKGDLNYLSNKLATSRRQAVDQYYPQFLHTLFFEGFARPEDQRDPATRQLLGEVKYLNGGLFLPHPIEEKYGSKITIPDAAFAELFDLFNRYSWNLDDTIGGHDEEINPDVLGYIFEKYINQKEFGAYYTRPEITEYLCEQTIHKLILDRLAELNQPIPGLPEPPKFETIGDLYTKLDAPRARQLLFDILPRLSLLDPACGSGAFLVAAIRTLVTIYQGVIGRIEFLRDDGLNQWLAKQKQKHPSLDYFIKKQVITQNLYGVDIMAEAVEIARLRLFLALVASARTVEDLEPLPNIDFNVLPGNSLIGLLRVKETDFNRYVQTDTGQAAQLGLFAAEKTKTYQETVAEKNRLVQLYKDASTYADDLQSLRDNITFHRRAANATLNQILLDQFGELGIQFERATWDVKRNKEGRRKKRPLTLADIEALQPFHWGYEFDEVMNERGGFDAIITNPPWEIFKPNAKEFFAEYSSEITKKKMTIKEFSKTQARLLKDDHVREAWLVYRSNYPHANLFFRNASQYENQISIVNSRKATTDINLYKLFLEQCYNLLCDRGQCGIVIPSGIYSDLGTKQLREMLFSHTQITGLMNFENRKAIFEGVDSRFKFVVLTFTKGGRTVAFPAAFMRHDVAELNQFPHEGALWLPINLVYQISPDSLSIMEFKEQLDVEIAKKMSEFPLLGEDDDVWTLSFSREFHMTDDSYLFKTEPGTTRLPLYEGKMIHQFNHQFDSPRFWVELTEGRKVFLKKDRDRNQILNYQRFRLAYRAIASSTNERTLICTILPSNTFSGNSLNTTHNQVSAQTLFFAVAMLNSFIIDYSLRQRVAANLNMFYLYQLPVPRLPEAAPAFAPIVERAAKLICTTPEFDDLAQEIGLRSHKNSVTDPVERAKLRAELDGLIAHVYGLTEEEFKHILATFPLVGEAVKAAALAEYRRFAPDPAVMALIAGGESAQVEFKIGACLNPYTGQKDGSMRQQIAKAVAAFMNSVGGGSLLIGVADDGTVVGVEREYACADRSKANWDGYALALNHMLNDSLSIENPFTLYQITSHTLNDKTICRLKIEPAPGPVYINKRLYVRSGNQSKELLGPDLVNYIQERWE